ncbi:MAG: hypothetical protein HC847_07185 [Hydrococcus sp. RU_2_2]|jgi:hypothetical protein|nr:hypothetical protein [Hydrococcus sp. RU_2_2]NJP18838.1 hypothetical protein [Hydrococcus sp. CRU_1_1]NJQ98513.1 hypothetical protein [Hydrococcus sp. CSU_1_8]
MQLTNRANAKSIAFNQSDWYFIQPTLSGIAGVIIGLVVANFLGWV